MSCIKSKPIKQLEEEVKKDLILRIDRTDENQADTPRLHNKYHREYRLVSEELIKAGNSLLKLRRDKWMYYMGKASPEVYDKNPLGFKIMKSDVKMMIDTDDEVIQYTYFADRLDIKKKFLKETLEAINRRSFEIGNILKTIYFKHGIKS